MRKNLINRRRIVLALLAVIVSSNPESELFAQPPEATQAAATTDGIQNAKILFTKYKPQSGKPHLDFILPSIEGDKSLRLSSYRGKKVLLLHFASW